MNIDNIIKEEVVKQIVGEIKFTKAEINSIAKEMKNKILSEARNYMIQNIDHMLDDNDKIWKAFYTHAEAEILALFPASAKPKAKAKK